jgi:hypothetical protein
LYITNISKNFVKSMKGIRGYYEADSAPVIRIYEDLNMSDSEWDSETEPEWDSETDSEWDSETEEYINSR